jgi:glycosyltransferase involved in cell wall biosynthesis
MACFIKAPDANGKGCVSFTTPERDMIIKKDPQLRAAIETLKQRYLIGLHHNWHDHSFGYDPLFDFSMAGDGDLIERDGKPFARAPLDACNFAPACFVPRGPAVAPFWDVLCTSRAVFFKGLPEFLQAIRSIYDRRRFIRVLHLCPVPAPNQDGTHLHDIRQRYEAIFAPEERRLFTLMTMEWDNPFPLDLETLAFFYRACRVYVHSAPEERRARAAAYAWACRMPVVSRENVASIVPVSLRRRPFWFEFDKPEQMADAILAAVDGAADDPQWSDVADEFNADKSARRLDTLLDAIACERGASMSMQSINALGLDIRLGRHHDIGGGGNRVAQTLPALCHALLSLPNEILAKLALTQDPEVTVARAAAIP